jgi:hypothetical protein
VAISKPGISATTMSAIQDRILPCAEVSYYAPLCVNLR